MKTFVFDLDGTLCTQETRENYEHAKPILPMIEKVNELYEDGHRIIIYTARGMSRKKDTPWEHEVANPGVEFRGLTTLWLLRNNVQYHELVFGKPSGDFYIDDKGIDMQKFLESLEQINKMAKGSK